MEKRMQIILTLIFTAVCVFFPARAGAQGLPGVNYSPGMAAQDKQYSGTRAVDRLAPARAAVANAVSDKDCGTQPDADACSGTGDKKPSAAAIARAVASRKAAKENLSSPAVKTAGQETKELIMSDSEKKELETAQDVTPSSGPDFGLLLKGLGAAVLAAGAVYLAFKYYNRKKNG
jgi:hypothetical protein